jgi:hypothetical protein
MTDDEFDDALIAGAFAIAARDGWSAVSVIRAAREADLPLDRARQQFAGRDAILMRFGKLADSRALADAPATGPVRERLFDLLMRRFDVLQTHRPGVLALLKSLPADPGTALLLTAATVRSMGWMLQAAGIPTSGLSGQIAVNALLGVWLYAIRAWQTDDTPDLSTTMAALDKALSRAEQLAGWFGRATPASDTGPKPFPEPPLGGLDASYLDTGTITGAAGLPPTSDAGGI